MNLCRCVARMVVSLAGILPAASMLHAFQSPAPGYPTPIRYVVVIFDENNSFDHYFGVYPKAANPQGQPLFTAAAGTPAVNGLSGALRSIAIRMESNPSGWIAPRTSPAITITITPTNRKQLTAACSTSMRLPQAPLEPD